MSDDDVKNEPGPSGIDAALAKSIDETVAKLAGEFEGMLHDAIEKARTKLATPGEAQGRRIVNAGDLFRQWTYAKLAPLEVFTLALLKDRDRMEGRVAVLEERVLDLMDDKETAHEEC